MDKKIVLTEGTVTYRKSDGRYMGKYFDSDRKYKYVYASTYNECALKLNDAIAYRDRYSSSLKLYDWLDDWRRLYKREKQVADTYRVQGYQIDKYIKGRSKSLKNDYAGCLVNKPLPEYNSNELQSYLLSIEKIRTREDIYNILNGAFRKAYATRLIDFNPMLAVEIAKHKRKKSAPLTNADLIQFFEDLKADNNFNELMLFYKLTLYNGCRRGETWAFRKSDFDFAKKQTHIPGTKTVKSDRIIPLFNNVAELVQELPDGSLFKYKCDYYSRKFRAYCPGHTVRDLRKTFSTMCRAAGVELDTLQEWLGHTDIKTTRAHYIDILTETHQREAHKITGVFKV